MSLVLVFVQKFSNRLDGVLQQRLGVVRVVDPPALVFIDGLVVLRRPGGHILLHSFIGLNASMPFIIKFLVENSCDGVAVRIQ